MRRSADKNNHSEGNICQSRRKASPTQEPAGLLIGSSDSTRVQVSAKELIRVDERRRFRARILLIESDAVARKFYTQFLGAAGFNITVASSRSEGLAILDQAPGTEIIISAYSLGEKDPRGGVTLADKVQDMWVDSRPDRPPSLLLTGSYEQLEQELMAEDHGAYFCPVKQENEIVRAVDLLLLKRRKLENQEIFSIEHVGRAAATTYCTDAELIAAVYTRHRRKPRPLGCALRERLVFDMLAHHTNRWLSLKDISSLLQKSDFHARHDHRDWIFSPGSLKQSLQLLRQAINKTAIDLHADFRANQLLLMKESGRYDRLYQLNCAVGWMHP
jgi:DNA-binding response OmpR family regulator